MLYECDALVSDPVKTNMPAIICPLSNEGNKVEPFTFSTTADPSSTVSKASSKSDQDAMQEFAAKLAEMADEFVATRSLHSPAQTKAVNLDTMDRWDLFKLVEKLDICDFPGYEYDASQFYGDGGVGTTTTPPGDPGDPISIGQQCKCSGRMDPWNRGGADCKTEYNNKAYCNTEVGACGDGIANQYLYKSEYSFNACDVDIDRENRQYPKQDWNKCLHKFGIKEHFVLAVSQLRTRADLCDTHSIFVEFGPHKHCLKGEVDLGNKTPLTFAEHVCLMRQTGFLGLCMPLFPVKATTTVTTTTATETTSTSTFHCRSNGYKLCASLDQCVRNRRWCDGKADCDDGSDEANNVCTTSTASSTTQTTAEFRCKAGKIQFGTTCCINPKWVCDGSSDCDGVDEGADEVGCNTTAAPPADTPPADTIPALATTTTTTPSSADPDCPPNRRLCLDPQYKQCVHDLQWCDGTQDCADGTDEQGCPSTTTFTTPTSATVTADVTAENRPDESTTVQTTEITVGKTPATDVPAADECELGWSGPGVGSNWCNSCTCFQAYPGASTAMMCTEMACSGANPADAAGGGETGDDLLAAAAAAAAQAATAAEDAAESKRQQTTVALVVVVVVLVVLGLIGAAVFVSRGKNYEMEKANLQAYVNPAYDTAPEAGGSTTTPGQHLGLQLASAAEQPAEGAQAAQPAKQMVMHAQSMC